MQDIYTFKNLFSPSDIQSFKDEMNALRDNPDSLKQRTDFGKRKNKLFIIKNKNPLKNRLEKLLTQHLPFEKETYSFFSMNFYELQLPYGLHCDNLGPEKGFYQVIIPLDIQPDNPVYTIIFDQTSEINTEWVSPVYKKPKDYKPFHNTPIFDPSYYPLWSDEYKIDDSDGEKFWGDNWRLTYKEAYKGFSIKHAYTWNVGDMFVFKSHFNHCASELESLNVEQKSGLLTCLEKA